MCSGFGERRPLLIYEKPPGRSALFDLPELLMPSLDEQVDLPAHGRKPHAIERKGLGEEVADQRHGLRMRTTDQILDQHIL